MSIQEQFPFAAHTLLPNISYPTLRNAIQHRAKEFDLPLVQDSETEIQLKTAYGTYRFWQGDEAKFQQTYSEGSSAIHIGEIEFDESSQTYQVQVSFTISDGSGTPMGAATIGLNAEMF